MRITSAEIIPVHLISDLRLKDKQSLPARLDAESTQFIKAVSDSLYTQRAFIQAIKAKGSKLDIYL
jgi:predicted DNA-binding ArsR family transcriptional regulator